MKKTQLEIYNSAAAAANKCYQLKGHTALTAKLSAFDESGFDQEKDYDLWSQFFDEQTNRCNQLASKPAPSSEEFEK